MTSEFSARWTGSGTANTMRSAAVCTARSWADGEAGELRRHGGPALARGGLASIGRHRLLWAAWIALTMSSELLFQPFVWRNWPWGDVLLAWGELAVRRLEVALAIAAALMAAWAVPVRSLGVRALLLAAAIAVAAWGAETLVMSEQTGFGDRAPGTRLFTWALLAGSVAAMFYLWRRGSEAREVAQALHLRHVQMQQQLTQLKLQALRSQIEPHFLFNTLATVRSLRGSDPQRGGRLLAHLIAYMRSTANSASPEGTTLAAEIEVIRAYLGVVAIRMSDRIAVAIDVPDDLLGAARPVAVGGHAGGERSQARAGAQARRRTRAGDRAQARAIPRGERER